MRSIFGYLLSRVVGTFIVFQVLVLGTLLYYYNRSQQERQYQENISKVLQMANSFCTGARYGDIRYTRFQLSQLAPKIGIGGLNVWSEDGKPVQQNLLQPKSSAHMELLELSKNVEFQPCERLLEDPLKFFNKQNRARFFIPIRLENGMKLLLDFSLIRKENQAVGSLKIVLFTLITASFLTFLVYLWQMRIFFQRNYFIFAHD